MTKAAVLSAGGGWETSAATGWIAKGTGAEVIAAAGDICDQTKAKGLTYSYAMSISAATHRDLKGT
ncbi:MAG: hypothetical protein O2943_07955 [Actinomycetota bacterium]|nr:hypothetical protein [Actinomycetota bacterium]